jgi:hypothetical protein
MICIDPSGFSFWTKIRGTVIRVVAAVADAYGCSGFCSAAVGGYQGAKQGGFAGGVVGAVGGYFGYQNGVNYPMTNGVGEINWTNFAVQASTNAAVGCASASTGGGNCGRGAAAGVVSTYGQANGFMASIIAGCASGKIGGSTCGGGALDTVTTYAIHSAIGYAIASQQAGKMLIADRSGGGIPGNLEGNVKYVYALIVDTGNSDWISKADQTSYSFSESDPTDSQGNRTLAEAKRDRIIFYKGSRTLTDYGQRYLVAHELGHVIISEARPDSSGFVMTTPNYEAAADRFATQLLGVPAERRLPRGMDFYFKNATDRQRQKYYPGRTE